MSPSCSGASSLSRALAVTLLLSASFLPGACQTASPRHAPGLLPRNPVVTVSAGKDGGWFLFSNLDRTLQDWAATFDSHDPTDSPQLRESLEGILHGLVEEHREEILASLHSPITRRRSIAAASLGFSRRPKDASVLLELLEDADEGVVANALLGLWLCGGSFPQQTALGLIESAPDAGVRANAALALAGLSRLTPNTGLLATLSLATSDKDARVRLHAVRALGRLRNPLALGPLVRATEDDDPVVQAAACLALGKLPQADSARALSRALDSENPLVHESAARALLEHARSHP